MPRQLSARKRPRSLDDLIDEVGVLLVGVKRFSQARTRRALVREARLLLNEIDDRFLASEPVDHSHVMQDAEHSSELHDHVLS